MTTLFFTAFGLGLLLNAAPGPVFAETVRRGIAGGFRLAFAVQLGSLVGDAAWAAVGLLSIALLLQLDALRVPIGLFGAGYLLRLAWDSWRAARDEFVIQAPPGADPHRAALVSGLFLSLTNPQHLAYWAAVGSALGAFGISHPTIAHYGVFFAGFLASSITWMFVMSALVDRVFRRIGARWARLTYRACAIALLALAVAMLRDLWPSPRPARSARPSLSAEP
jgi:chemosensory pili system protein ChpE/L-lysine exporter family protein LysE/ArgO